MLLIEKSGKSGYKIYEGSTDYYYSFNFHVEFEIIFK